MCERLKRTLYSLYFFTHVILPVVDRGAICSHILYYVDHHFWNIFLVMFRKKLLVSCLTFYVIHY